jgi:hypothetical protein
VPFFILRSITPAMRPAGRSRHRRINIGTGLPGHGVYRCYTSGEIIGDRSRNLVANLRPHLIDYGIIGSENTDCLALDLGLALR